MIFRPTFTKLIPLLIVIILVYTRFIGLDWGLPYPMHPDERNMTVAVMQLKCEGWNLECMNPGFFAYGQLPLYMAYLTSHLYSTITHIPVTFETITLALRAISALSSIGVAYILWKMIHLFFKPTHVVQVLIAMMVIFVPAFIQYAHFGTTESLLMFLYTLLIYLSILYIDKKIRLKMFSILSGIVLGTAIGIKVSSALFVFIPFFALFFRNITKANLKSFKSLIRTKFIVLVSLGIMGLMTILFFLIASPYNLLDFEEFIGSMRYESDVGFGRYRAFYTRQFEYTIPLLFQSVKIFPYTLGAPFFILFLFAFFILPYDRKYNFLRIQFLLFFIPNSFFYAKWSRFLSPIYPLMIFFAMSMIAHLVKEEKKHTLVAAVIVFIAILPGMAYISIYGSPDVRFTASEWIYTNIRNEKPILSETANVVDIPMPTSDVIPTVPLHPISFNFYDLEVVPELKPELKNHQNEATFVFVPSRRVFANHTCMWPKKEGMTLIDSAPELYANGYEKDRCKKLMADYPAVHRYYMDVFDPTKYVLLKEFTSYPKIELFGITLIEFPDEHAEETWTVFDHPVIRIYRKI